MVMRSVSVRAGLVLGSTVAVSLLATAVMGQQPTIPLRGPPLANRPANVQVLDPNGNVTQVIRQKVQLMPGKPNRYPLNNGSILPTFIYDVLPPSSSIGGGGGFGGFGGFLPRQSDLPTQTLPGTNPLQGGAGFGGFGGFGFGGVNGAQGGRGF